MNSVGRWHSAQYTRAKAAEGRQSYTKRFVLEALPTVNLTPGPNDNAVQAMALANQVQYLMMGDKKGPLALSKIGRYA